MAVRDPLSTRLFVDTPLAVGARVPLERAQVNYLVNVLRLKDGDTILVFNGADGEWQARLEHSGRRDGVLSVERETRIQPPPSDLDYLFAPLKQARLDYMVQKAVEMGVGRLRPVITERTQVRKLNHGRVMANAVEAAEQCGILTLPVLDEPTALPRLLSGWSSEAAGRRIVFCDEGDGGADPLAVLAHLPHAPLAVLVGPEGGFSEDERGLLHRQPFVTALPLGPRILRADTAAVAALALVQAARGDWANAAPAPH